MILILLFILTFVFANLVKEDASSVHFKTESVVEILDAAPDTSVNTLDVSHQPLTPHDSFSNIKRDAQRIAILNSETLRKINGSGFGGLTKTQIKEIKDMQDKIAMYIKSEYKIEDVSRLFTNIKNPKKIDMDNIIKIIKQEE